MKKTVKLSALLLCVAGMFSSSAMAVDGYKDIKFGTPKEQVLKSKLCSFEKAPSGQPGVEYYGCSNFKFGGKKVEAAVFFIDGKFMRLAVVQEYDLTPGLLTQLIKKYGDPMELLDKQKFNELESQPNKTLDIMFDNKTVALRLMSDANYNKSALIMYSAADYNDQLIQVQQNSVSNDL